MSGKETEKWDSGAMKPPVGGVGMGVPRVIQFKFLLETNRDDLPVGGNAKAEPCVRHLRNIKRRVLLRNVGKTLLLSL